MIYFSSPETLSARVSFVISSIDTLSIGILEDNSLLVILPITSLFSLVILTSSLVSKPEIPIISFSFNHSPKLFLPRQCEYFGLYSPTTNALI